MFFKISVLENFAIFTRKHLCWSLFFKKVPGLKPATVSKNKLQLRCFSVNFAKFLGAISFFIEHLWWLLLNGYQYFKGVLWEYWKVWKWKGIFLDGIYLLKVSNRNTRTGCKIFSKLKTERLTSFWCLYC